MNLSRLPGHWRRGHYRIVSTSRAANLNFRTLRDSSSPWSVGHFSASADRRLWFGKNAYNPGVLTKLVEIFRVYLNYCEVGKDKKAPAMKKAPRSQRLEGLSMKPPTRP